MHRLDEQGEEGYVNWQRRQRNGRIAGGILVIGAGVVYLLHQMDYSIPEWFFRWPTLLLALSFVTMIKHGWRDWRWVGFFLIGTLFMAGYMYPESAILKFKIPIILFILGIFIIVKPRNQSHRYRQYQMYRQRKFGHRGRPFGAPLEMPVQEGSERADDYLFMNNLFSGAEKVIFSKDFKGGEIRNTFGGCEINLMQADIQTEAVLLLNQQFGGTKLIIPSNWAVKTDITSVFAGIEDKRPHIDITQIENPKTLLLKGHLFMSGLEIVSY